MKTNTGISICIVILLLSTSFLVSASDFTSQKRDPQNESNTVCFDKIQEIMDHVDETLIYEVVETLVSFAPRETGTYGCEKSAEYLYKKISNLNVEANIQEWTAFGNQYNRKVLSGKNIEAVIPGTDPNSDIVLTLTAHYDSATRKEYEKQGLFSPGANDDASGVASVIAAAQALSYFSFEHTIKLIAVPGEEVGLLGSRAYVQRAHENNENIILNLNADMIGFADTIEDGNSLKMFGSDDADWAMDTLETVNENYNCGFEFYRGDIPKLGEGWGADCLSFMNYGYESVTFFEGGSYPYAHSPNDTLDRINASYIAKVTKLYVATLAYLADNGLNHPLVRISQPMRGKVYRDEKIIRTFDYEKPYVMFLNEHYKKAASSFTPTFVYDDIWIWTESYEGDSPLLFAEFFYDGVLAHVDDEAPFNWHLTKRSLREHEITVVVYDEEGNSCQDSLVIRFVNLRSNK